MIDSFKELLLKKSQDNPTLQMLIDVMKDDILVDKVLESLEKMAKPQATMGRSANAAVTAFGNQMKGKDVEQMRDALAHHISHYKSALKNGQRDVADKHLNKLVPLLHLAGKAAAHSNGQLGLDYTPMEPWETNYTTPERRPETGKLKEGTKGLRRRLNSTPRSTNPRSVPDYRYLEMAPHEEHADMKSSPHKGGYPWEEIQLGNPAKIDSKEAYLHLQDPGKQENFTSHPFDEHPIHQYADHSQDELNPQDLEQIATKIQGWPETEHNAKWMADLKAAHATDPEAFKARGKVKPEHFHNDLKLLRQPHATSDTEQVAPQVQQVAAATPQIQPTFTPKTQLRDSSLAARIAAAKAGGKSE